MKKVITITLVSLYALVDIITCISVFIFLSLSNKNLRDDITKFRFDASPFDLVMLSVFRSSIMLGACIGLLCNDILGSRRLRNSLTLMVYLSCFGAIYTVLKVLYFTSDTNNKDIRMWVITSVSFVSCIVNYISWNCLGKIKNDISYKKKILNINLTDGEIGNQLEKETLLDSSDDDESEDEGDKKDKVNSFDKKVGKKYSSTTIVLKLIKMAKHDLFYIFFAVFFLTMSSVGTVFLPLYTGEVLNYIVIYKDEAKFKKAMLYMALITLGTGFAAGMRAGLFTFVFSRYLLRLQNLLFSCIIKMEIGFFDIRKTGEITSRLTSDCTKIGDCIGLNLNVFLRSVVKIIGILFFMIKLSWKLSLLTLVSIPVIAIISEHFGDIYRKLSEKVQNSLAFANESAEESISSIRTVRSFAAEDQEIERYNKCLLVTYNLRKKECFVQVFNRWSIEITDLAMSLLVLYFGGHLVLQGSLSGGHLVSFILYSLELSFAFEEIADVYIGIMEAVGAARNVLVYIDRKPNILSSGTINLPAIKGDIKFHNVSFSYPSRPDVNVLKNLSFHAKPGEIVALVGPSGGGKSSIVNLLERFYDPTCGEVLLDGKKISNYNHKFLHNSMGLVQQEPVLFARSISDNITYGLMRNFNADDIGHAATMANANIFVECMPESYDTQTGEKGIQLSGGQKQRIAIARALIRDPSVLILDEATSALDTESEYVVQQAINKNLAGRTVILIAHRLSTIEKADKILVIDNGEVIQQGTHFSLLNQDGGIYANLVKRQLLGVNDAEQDVEERVRDD